MARKLLDRQRIEILINLVSVNRPLYDPSLQEHKDAEYMQNTWAAIARAMNDRELTGDDWKKKWKNLRDNYIRARRGEKTSKDGQEAKKSTWRWLEVMSFLDPFLDPNNVFSSSDCVSVMGTPPFLPISANEMKKRRLEKEDSLADKAFDQLHKGPTAQPIGQTPEPVPKSAEDLFFDSCAMRMKELPQQTRSFLQLQISQLFHNAENPSLPPVLIMPLPSHQFKFTQNTSPHPPSSKIAVVQSLAQENHDAEQSYSYICSKME